MGASSPSPRASGARQRLMRVPRPPVWYTHGHMCVNVGVGVVVGVCACRAQWEGLSGCVIVFDVTDRASFMACSKWLSLVRQRLSPGTKPGSIVLVGNRVDLNTRRSVDRQEALDWANDEGIDFCETSAVRGRRGAPTRNRVVDAHPPRARAAGALSLHGLCASGTRRRRRARRARPSTIATGAIPALSVRRRCLCCPRCRRSDDRPATSAAPGHGRGRAFQPHRAPLLLQVRGGPHRAGRRRALTAAAPDGPGESRPAPRRHRRRRRPHGPLVDGVRVTVAAAIVQITARRRQGPATRRYDFE